MPIRTPGRITRIFKRLRLAGTVMKKRKKLKSSTDRMTDDIRLVLVSLHIRIKAVESDVRKLRRNILTGF